MFSSITKRLRKPNLLAVSGINCINPTAPLSETAYGFHPDSTSIIASTSSTGT